jgi:hypothetical protein
VVSQQDVSAGDRGLRESHVGSHIAADNDIAARCERALPTTPKADSDRGRQRSAHPDHAAITAASAAVKTTVAMIK